ncbi:hypothetical protein [Sulfuricystis multivorans]|uniref:hypothetical protein n=1 Tax=Sulfuricystis multivorans TaxID=2211108 RepID=UPI000F831813|nr:hypothetical protein [Sulfuricystis multivorans]
MSILTQIIAAEADEVEAIGEAANPLDLWSGIGLRDLTIPRIAMLECVLTGELFDDAAAQCEPVYVSPDEGALVLRLSDALLARLAALDDERLEAVAAELTATEAFETAGWSEDEVATMLADLGELAQLAESQGQALFAWIHPLRT